MGKFYIARSSLGFIVSKFKTRKLPVLYLAVFGFYTLAIRLVICTGKIAEILGLLLCNNHSSNTFNLNIAIR